MRSKYARVFQAKLVVRLAHGTDAFRGQELRIDAPQVASEDLVPFDTELVEDVLDALEVQVERRGADAHRLGDLARRDTLGAVGEVQTASGAEERGVQVRFPTAALTARPGSA